VVELFMLFRQLEYFVTGRYASFDHHAMA